MRAPLVASAYVWAGIYYASAQQVTLWQINTGHLLSGVATLPLEPVGTVSDGQATTYLYRALQNVVSLESENGLTSAVTLLTPSLRTIITSASGRIELLGPSGSPTAALGCSLIDSDVGNCFEGSLTAPETGATGKPTPEVLGVSTPLPTISSSPSQSTTLSDQANPFPSNTASSSSTSSGSFRGSKTHSPAGVIAAGVIGGLVALSTALLGVILVWRRCRRRRSSFGSGHIRQEPEPWFLPPSSPPITTSKFNSTTRSTTLSISKAQTVVEARESNQSHHPAHNPVMDWNPGARVSATTSEYSPIHQYMANISDRLRRLEMAENIHVEPPPTYYAGSQTSHIYNQ